MKKSIICPIMLLALVHAQALAHNVSLNIHNTLSACVAIYIRDTSIHANMLLANTVFQLRKPIGECGCRSALVSYDSVTTVNTAQQVLQNGLIGISKSGNKTLALASEQALVTDRQIQLQFRCAPAL